MSYQELFSREPIALVRACYNSKMQPLEQLLKEEGHRLGFDLVGIAPATAADGFDRLQEWLARGFAGEMGYMQRQGAAREHPRAVLPEVRSVVMVAMNYGSSPEATQSPGVRGKVARYVRGPDYHDVLRERLNRLLQWLQRERAGCIGRGVVDTAPLLERDFARCAGLGWFGKNTMLINKRQGSYFFLGALLVNITLQPDASHDTSHCGTCTACLDACPTQAFAGPGWLDARRCISYLTIELKSDISEELRPGLGDWLFGCDICQEVCPWNRHAPATKAPWSREDLASLDPVELLGLTAEQFRARFRDTPLLRTKRRGLLRNAALVLGNQGDAKTLPALYRALDDVEPLVREAARWAIDKIVSRGISLSKILMYFSPRFRVR